MAGAFAVTAAPVVAALLVVLPASGAPAPSRTASLKLASLAPLAVTGRNFGARENVVVTYLAAGGASRTAGARATKLGRFRAVFRIRAGRCDSFTVRATGTAGSRAILQVERTCEENAKGPPKRAPREKPKPGRG